MASNMMHRFISADDHIDLRWLPKDLWSERLPARLRERGPRVIDNDHGAFWSWEDQTLQSPWLLHRGAGERRHVGDRARRRHAARRAAADHG